MMKARFLPVSLLVLAVACRDSNQPTRISGPPDPSKIISDGAHGGNKDFFFLPPMVPLPVGNADFEVGKFNNTLKPSLRVDICELKAELVNGAAVLPKATTECVSGAPLKRFAAGTVNLVNLPLRENGWWTLFNLPPDGFYYVLWDTRQSNLNVNKYYRIKVFIEGATEPLGVADVDPMSSIRQWKYTLTGEVIQLVDDVLLPIPFRVEKGGGSALCGDASLCVSTTISNSSPTGSQVVTVDGGDGAGAIAGAKFPNGWLPANGPQSVVVTISKVDIGTTDPVTGESTKPCHEDLALQQFPGCFNFTTTPRLAAIDEDGNQFATDVTVAVCYSLQNSGDPREKFAEMYASGPGEPAHALQDASDAGLLSAATRDCSAEPIITAAPSSGVSQFARTNWRRIKSGVGALFGVQTAYGVDLGLGGITKRFSNIGPAVTAHLAAVGPTDVDLPGGGNVQAFVRLTGSNHHDGQHQNSTGLAGLRVQFQVSEGDGTIAQLGDEIGGATQLDVVTTSAVIDPESPTSGGGYAAVNWAVPSTPGTYHVTASGPALGEPVTFAVTVTPTSTFNVENAIGAGLQFTCAIANGGSAYCWGLGAQGQLGNGTNPVTGTPPVLVSGGHQFAQISTSNLTACGVTVDHDGYCWGLNTVGQLGNGTTSNSNVPVLVSGGLQFRAIEPGANASCGVTTTGDAYCWGSASTSTLGDGQTAASLTPVRVAGNLNWKSLTPGLTFFCGVTVDNAGYCWGSNGFGTVAPQGVQTLGTPTPISGNHTFSSVVSGAAWVCGLENTSALCWGLASFGTLGEGTNNGTVFTPTLVSGGLSFRSVHPGNANNIFSAVCGITTDGDGYCWGVNRNGQLGTTANVPVCSEGGSFGTITCATTPVPVAGGHKFLTIRTSAEHTCGITTDRKVYCWGLGLGGELGLGNQQSSSVPVQVPGLVVN